MLPCVQQQIRSFLVTFLFSMKLLTHNLLQCHASSCASSNNYPLLLNNIEIEQAECEYNQEFTQKLMGKIDYNALYSVCQSVSF